MRFSTITGGGQTKIVCLIGIFGKNAPAKTETLPYLPADVSLQEFIADQIPGIRVTGVEDMNRMIKRKSFAGFRAGQSSGFRITFQKYIIRVSPLLKVIGC
jgi:hypothetical protein